MKVKQPTTYYEQIEVMRSRGCEINDDVVAIEFLKKVNYYRFSGYFFAFEQDDDTFAEGVTFEKISSVYAFDQELRIMIMRAVSAIELSAKSIISYHHGHQYGALGYMDSVNFGDKHDHGRFIAQLEVAMRNNKNAQFVKHHFHKYGGNFPIWVAAELFTMSMISIVYADLKVTDKKKIAQEYSTDYVHLESWLHSASVLRNICAHHGRLYHVLFHQPPKLPRAYVKNSAIGTYSLGRQLCMLKLLYANWRDEWDNAFVLPLSALVEKYGKSIDIRKVGLPENWEDVLTW
ncbi:MAG: Abi family protein [Defluviitaleaceae bacterium]|nr:Abi family protein [Defluviitaleaceae bacterium]